MNFPQGDRQYVHCLVMGRCLTGGGKGCVKPCPNFKKFYSIYVQEVSRHNKKLNINYTSATVILGGGIFFCDNNTHFWHASTHTHTDILRNHTWNLTGKKLTPILTQEKTARLFYKKKEDFYFYCPPSPS